MVNSDTRFLKSVSYTGSIHTKMKITGKKEGEYACHLDHQLSHFLNGS